MFCGHSPPAREDSVALLTLRKMLGMLSRDLRYNAVVKDYGSNVIKGTLFVTNLAQVPSDYLVQHRGSLISKKMDLGTLFCNRMDPLHLIKLPSSSEDGTDGRLVVVDAHEDTKIEDFKRKIEQVETRLKASDMRLFILEDGEILDPGRTLRECGIVNSNGKIVEVKRALTGGGGTGGGGYPGFISVDLEARQVCGEGVPKCYSWETYGYGMNLYGSCNKRNCISKLTKSKEVVLNMDYGRIRMKKGWNKFECPACKVSDEERDLFMKRRQLPVPWTPARSPPITSEKDNGTKDEPGFIGTFTPTSYLLTCGRALFRFKKSGVRESVQTVILESLAPISDYKTFDERAGMCLYDVIEITTVSITSSPYNCVQFTQQITEKEYALFCGHFLHPLCTDKDESRLKCPVCNSSLARNPDSEVEILSDDDDDFIGYNAKSTCQRKSKGSWDGLHRGIGWYRNYHLVGEFAHAAEVDEWDHEMDDCVFLRAFEAKKADKAKRKEAEIIVMRSGKKMKRLQ